MFMTLFTFILSVVPLIIARGAGAEMRQALGTAVFLGMIGVTLFGSLLTPVFYVSVRWIVAKVRGTRVSGAEGRAAPVEHAVS